MSAQVLAESLLAYAEELNIFQKPIQCVGIEKIQTITCYPVNDYTSQGVIQFSIPGHGTHYIDMKNIMLNLACKIVRKDGKDVEVPTANKGSAGVINNFLHSLWSRVDVSLQNKTLSQSDNSYPYLAYFKALLNRQKTEENKLAIQMFYPDTAGSLDDGEWYVADNEGFKARSKFFNKSQEVDMSGHLAADIFETNRYIPCGVPLEVKLHPSSPEFCLMSSDTDETLSGAGGGYKVIITKASLEVPKVVLAPEVLIAHSQVLEDTPAIFPYMKSEIKKHNLTSGCHDAEINNPFMGRIPSELILGLVTDTAHHGSYKKNPFNFQNAKLSTVQMTVDGQDIAGSPIKTKYVSDDPHKSNYMEAYKTLIGVNGTDHDIPISREDYPQGFCLYRFLTQADNPCGGDDVIALKRTGNVRLYMAFEEALKDAHTVVMWAKFPSALSIDKTKTVREL
jgi:hypothetical protein